MRVLAMAVIFSFFVFAVNSFPIYPTEVLSLIFWQLSLFSIPCSTAPFPGQALALSMVWEDLILGRFVGLNALAKGITGYVIGLGEKRVFKENFLVPLLVCFSGTVLCQVVYLLLLSLVSGENVWLRFKGVILPQALYNSLLGLLIYGKFAKSATRGILKRSRHY